MKFIQEKVGEVGKVNSTATNHLNNDSQLNVTYEVSNVVANPTECRIDYDEAVAVYGDDSPAEYRELRPNRHGLSLKDVQNIVVATEEQLTYKKGSTTVDPTIWTLQVTRLPTAAEIAKSKRYLEFCSHCTDKDKYCSLCTVNEPKIEKVVRMRLMFYDEEMANRVAKALVHAVELCGGGSKPEPF